MSLHGPADPFVQHAAKGSFAELYEVVRTAIVVKEGKTYKLEVVKVHTHNGEWPSHHFAANAYSQEEIEVPRSYYGADADETQRTDKLLVWASWLDFPWVHESEADEAMRRALGWLTERARV